MIFFPIAKAINNNSNNLYL